MIDNELDESPKNVILGIMRWREKKHLHFNLIIFCIVLLAVAVSFYERPNVFGYIFDVPFFQQS